MMYVIIRTGGGKKFARRIGQELKQINQDQAVIIETLNQTTQDMQQRLQLETGWVYSQFQVT